MSKAVRFEELPLGEKPRTPQRSASTQHLPSSRSFTKESLTDITHNPMPFQPLEATVSNRPTTSNGFRVPFNLSDPIGSSHYDQQFYPKYTGKAEPIRTGTASGSRKNNPHPSNEFMVFRFRSGPISVNPNCDWSQPIGDKLLSQVIKNQMKSTYKSDFINNVEKKREFEERAKHTQMPSSTARLAAWKKDREAEMDNAWPPMHYNHPFKYESLNIAPTRFGSNVLHGCQTPAYGIVPSCSSFWHDYPKKL